MSYVQSVLGELAVRGRRLLVSPLFYLGLAVVLGVAMFHPPLLGAALALLVGSPVLYHGAVSFVRPLVGRSAGTHHVPPTPVASSPRASVPSGRATGNDMVDTLVDKLRRSGLTVSTDWSFACDVLSRLPDEKYHSLKSHPDKIHGFVYQGVIYINPSSATAEAPLHEYTHVWAEVLRQKNPREWEHIVGLMKQEVSLWDTVKSSYPHLETDDEIADEVLATFSGRYAHAFLQQHALSGRSPRDVLGAVADALDTFWRAVCQFFGCHYSSKEAIAERCLRDLLQGVNPLDYADSRQQLSDRKPLHSLSLTPKHQPVMNQVKSLTLLTGEQARQTLSEILAHAREDGRGDVHYDTRVGAVGYYPDRTGAGDEVYTAFDNSSGDCWCEDFKTALGAQRWCVCHADADDVRRQEAAGLIGLESSVVDTIPLKSDNLGESVTYEYDLGDDEVLSVTMQFSDGRAEELPGRDGKAVPEWNRLQLIYPKLLDIDLDKDHQALVTRRTGKIWKGLSDAQKVVAAAMTFGIAFRLSEQDVLHVREEKNHGGDAVMTDVGTPLVMATFGDLRDARAYREEAKVFLEEHRSRRPDSLAAAGRDAHIGTIILTERSFDGLKDECVQLSPLPPHVRFDDSGEFEVEMSFYDGYARDLNPKGLGMYDRLGLYYPTVKEVLADPAKQELISRHTGRQWSEGSRQEQIFDIALKFGQASRVHCPKERFDAAVDAVIERTTDRHARRFTPEQREVIMLAANCNGEDEYTGQFREVFFEQLHGKAREQMDGVNKAWVHDSLEEMRDLANGLHR